jgi:hypothetical protein
MIETSTNFQDLNPAIFSNQLSGPFQDRNYKGRCLEFRRQGIISGKKQNGTLIE